MGDAAIAEMVASSWIGDGDIGGLESSRVSFKGSEVVKVTQELGAVKAKNIGAAILWPV